jgi:chorismate mutase/prephenate dehydrogenase
MKKDSMNRGKSLNIGKEIPKTDEKKLMALRDNIDAIDGKIVELLAKRQAEVDKVVSIKKEHHIPVYHPAREEDIISDRRHRGRETGLDPDYLEEIFRCILRQSRVEQNFSISAKGVKPGASVLVVGGTRGMGEYFNEWFKKAGYKTRVMGSKDWDDVDELCRDIDLAVISVPIDVTEAVVNDIAPHLSSSCILTDLTSIKKAPVEAMLAAHKGPVVGLHPLFGPTTSTMDKQLVVTTPGRDPEACRWVIDQFVAWGAVMVESNPEEHDDIMSIVQAIRHFATFAFGQFLHRRRIDLSRTLDFSSPIYRLELGMVGRLFAQDPVLYAEIIFASKERMELLKEYINSLSSNMSMIDRNDKNGFIEQFNKITEWFGPFGDQALRESSYLIDRLIERF